jgi:hypothetical protein
VNNGEIIMESVDDPVEAQRIREQIERGWRNAEWLSNHWADLLPQARGRFVAVAGQEAHVADSIEQAWAWAKTAHPEDDGALVQYVRPEQGPRIYANRRQVVQV